MGDEQMPSDPFREGQPDWGPLAANNAAFLSAHIAAGMAEPHALELTKTYLQWWLSVMLATSAAQQAPDQQQGEAPG